MAFVRITDAGLKEVAKLEQLKSLRIEGTQISDSGLKEVAKLKHLTGLNLAGTKVTKPAVADLKKALPKLKIHGGP